jgi:hypothetical protein
VRIYADGTGVPEDIRRMLEESEPSVRKAAAEHGKAYSDAFDKETSKEFRTRFGKSRTGAFNELSKGFKDSVRRLDLAETYLNGPEWKKFVRQVRREFPNEMEAAARLAVVKMEAAFRDSGDLDALMARSRRFGIEVRQAQEELVRAHEEALTEIAKRNERELHESAKRFRNNMQEISEHIELIEKGIGSPLSRRRLYNFLQDLRQIGPVVARNHVEMVQFNESITDMERRIRRANPHIDVLDRRFQRVGHIMGRLFGKGSRNDFLNFFGSFVGLLAQTPRLLTQFASRISQIGAAFSESFVTGLKETAVMGLRAAGAIAAFVAFLAILGAVLGPVIGLLSGLVGILTALASSVVMGAIGALAGFGPLLLTTGPIVGGIVAVVQAIKDAEDQAPKLAKSLDAIKSTAKDTWEIFKDRALQNLGESLSVVNRLMERNQPLVEAAGKGFNRFFSQIVESANSPAMQKFFDRFERFLPSATERLGEALGNFGEGLGGVLRGSIPLSNRLLDWLVDITDKFSEWANSKDGQRSIKNFLRDAGDSAKSIGNFLEGAWNWFWKIVRAAKSEGDNLWERIGGKFQEWADYIEKNPDLFEDWMKDADELAGDIGNLVDSLVYLIDTLDSPENRKLGNSIVTGLALVIASFAKVNEAFFDFGAGLAGGGNLPNTDSVAGQIGGWLHDLALTIAGIAETIGKSVWYVIGGKWVDDMMGGIEAALKAAGGIVSSAIKDFLGGLKDLGSGGGGAMVIKPTFDPSGIAKGIAKLPDLVGPAIGRVLQQFNNLDGRSAARAGNIAIRIMSRISPLPGLVQGVINLVVSRWGNVAERISRTLGDVWRAISSKFTAIPGNVAAVVTDIVNAFSGLGQRIINAIGSINIHINWPDPPGWLSKVTASGGIFAGAQARIIGEAGPEAVVPLNRPLSMVDPSVRWLSAIAQGKTGGPMASGGIGGASVVDVGGLTIVTPSEDPLIVAKQAINELVAKVV